MDVCGVAIEENTMEEQHQQQEKKSHRENFEMLTISVDTEQSFHDDSSPNPFLPCSDEDSEPQGENNYLLVHIGNECSHANNIVVSHNGDDNENRIHPNIRRSSSEPEIRELYEHVVEEVKLNLSADGNGEGAQQPSSLLWTVLRNVKTSRRYYLCVKCQAGTNDWEEKYNHAQLHLADSQAVVCGLCGWFLKPNAKAIQLHKYGFHKGVPYGEGQFNFSCKNCKARFKNLIEFRNHQGFGCPSLSHDDT